MIETDHRLRALATALALVLVGATVGSGIGVGGGLAASDGDDGTFTGVDLATDHGLASNESITQFKQSGYAEGDVNQFRMQLAIAEERDDLPVDVVASDTRNDYLLINYSEDYPRELRFLIPREYITPFETEADSLNTDHVAKLQPVRGGEYLEVRIAFEGQATVVLPLHKDHQVSYTIIERADERIERIIGFSPLDREYDWRYIEHSRIEQNATIKINSSMDEMVVQYDTEPREQGETWVNVPTDERIGSDVYMFSRGNETATYIVVRSDRSPAIRYRTEGVTGGTIHGVLNEVAQIPGNVVQMVKDRVNF